MSIPALIAQRAEENPDRAFLTEVDGRTASFAEFHDESLRWATGLNELGVEPGDTVLTMQPPGIDAFASWIGLSWLRAIDTACNTEYRGRMLAYVADHSGAKVAICSKRWLDRLAEVAHRTPNLTTVVVPDTTTLPEGMPWRVVTKDEVIGNAKPLTDAETPDVWDIAVMIFTSGTTGTSKGVLLPWGQQHESAVGVIPLDSVSAEDVFYTTFPMYHGSGRIGLCLMAMANGRIVVRERFSGEHFWTDVRSHGVTTTSFVASVAAFLWNQPSLPDDAENPLRRAIMLPLIPQYREFQERFGLTLRTTWAMTEVSPPFGMGWGIDNPASCGRVRDGYEVRIVDDHDFEVPVGESGELMVRHARPWTLCQGYFGTPEKATGAWRNGWFHTGDAFRRDANGNYYFVDRIKDAIRRRGENISSFEVEQSVNEHPDVVESAAVAVPSEWAEDEVKIVVVRQPNSTLTPEQLIEWLAPRMARFMIPRYVEFVDELPKTDATLRVQKNQLRAAGISPHTWDREQAGMDIPL